MFLWSQSVIEQFRQGPLRIASSTDFIAMNFSLGHTVLVLAGLIDRPKSIGGVKRQMSYDNCSAWIEPAVKLRQYSACIDLWHLCGLLRSKSASRFRITRRDIGRHCMRSLLERVLPSDMFYIRLFARQNSIHVEVWVMYMKSRFCCCRPMTLTSTLPRSRCMVNGIGLGQSQHYICRLPQNKVRIHEKTILIIVDRYFPEPWNSPLAQIWGNVPPHPSAHRVRTLLLSSGLHVNPKVW